MSEFFYQKLKVSQHLRHGPFELFGALANHLMLTLQNK